MSAPMSPGRLAEIRAELARYQGHTPVGFACCSAHGSADAVPALLAEVERLRDQRSDLFERIDSLASENAELRAELAARPTRADVLREAADEGPKWASCLTESVAMAAFRGHLRRMAVAAEQGETDGPVCPVCQAPPCHCGCFGKEPDPHCPHQATPGGGSCG